MSETLKAFTKELKEINSIDSSKRLKNTDWQSVHTISFLKDGSFSLNEHYPSAGKVKWDLHYMFRFSNVKILYIENLADCALMEVAGKDAFDFKFWFNKFEHLNGLNLKLGAFENNRIANCYKVKFKEETFWILQYVNNNEYGIELWLDDKKCKDFYFGNNKKKSQGWFVHILEYAIDNKKIPDDDWFEKLKKRDTNTSLKERRAVFNKAENKPTAKEGLY